MLLQQWQRTFNGFLPGTSKELSSGDWSRVTSESEIDATREADKKERRTERILMVGFLARMFFVIDGSLRYLSMQGGDVGRSWMVMLLIAFGATPQHYAKSGWLIYQLCRTTCYTFQSTCITAEILVRFVVGCTLGLFWRFNIHSDKLWAKARLWSFWTVTDNSRLFDCVTVGVVMWLSLWLKLAASHGPLKL
jgi:hypothetical protein